MAGGKLGKLFKGKNKAAQGGDEPEQEDSIEGGFHLENEPSPNQLEMEPADTSADDTMTTTTVEATPEPTPEHPQAQRRSSMPQQTAALASHPVTPARDPPQRRSVTHDSPNTGTEFQTHLRKVTASLVDILDQMSNSSATTPAGSTKDGVQPRRTTIGSRGDSVTTMVDLEAAGGNPAATGEVVSAQHVRRLTTTVVDILRSIASPQQQAALGVKDIDGMAEGSHLLADCGSELSVDDKLSLSSAGISTGRDSEISAATALLKAQYLPQIEYRGDDVRPFYLDKARRTGPLTASDDEFNTPGGSSEAASEIGDDYPIPKKLKKTTRINWFGLFIFLYFCCTLVVYVGIRASKTLGLGGNLWYGVIVLIVEVLGGVAMLPYGLCLCMRVVDPPPEAVQAAGKGQTALTAVGYHVRVVIPCYKEPLDVISKTFMAAMYASLPANCRRTVYLLDDGRDAEKRQFVRSLGLSNAVYVSGRKRAKGEMNGKSANINNAMRQIYPQGVPVPLDEVICVFDADQVPNADFFSKTVPLMDGGQDVAMVLSPQTFYNLNPDGDIFNHANVHFWDYTQPGYDALGLISCTGTNFLLRAKAFDEAGWFPEWTLTEDFALGIELKKRGWQCRYVDEYLAVGEAPEEVRNCFQQRSRWAKGHFQVFFGRGRNPAFGAGSKGLSALMRWMYGSVVLSYFSAFLGTPLLMLVPIVTVWFGAFPIVINFWAALSITIYYSSTLLLSLLHQSMWFASVSNSILWFAFLKAMYRASIGRWLSGTIVFKVTAKGLQKLNNLPLRDVWMSTLWFVFSLVTLIFGMVHFFKGGVLDTPLAISLIFMAYNLIPQYLLLQYAAYSPRMFFNAVCKLAMLLSTAMMITGLVLIWVLYPQTYSYKSALGHSLFFIDSQRVGALPEDFRVTWRQSAFLDEAVAPVYLAINPNETFLTDEAFNGFGGSSFDSFGSFGDPFGGSSSSLGAFGDPFGGRRRRLAQTDPFAVAADEAAGGPADPFAVAADSVPSNPASDAAASGVDPFAVGAEDPGAPAAAGAAGVDPFAQAAGSPGDAEIIEGGAGSLGADPFSAASAGAGLDPFASSSTDPFAEPSTGRSPGRGSADPFDPFASEGSFGLDGETPELATDGSWDLSGGWLSGMAGGNIKATTPVAFTTAVLAWGYMAFPDAYESSGQTAALRDSVRWGADYLAKVHRFDPEKNTSLLVTRVGDVDTELLLWYRPEDGGARDAYAVDLNSEVGGYGADLGGSVAAGLAAASTLFASDPADSEYAASLLQRAKEVYDAARPAKFKFTDSDYNMTLLYNSSTVYDDLAWAAGWLYKATREDSYLSDVYDYYVKHLEAEAEVADWKYAFDWDNVFWPLNLLMAQETGKGTFKKQTEQFLRNWMCANNAANYTQRGRAFNAMSASMGATANAAMAALMYSDMVKVEDAAASQTYKCWALSQMRYMLGDSGRSLVVGVGENPPKRTQDRGAACPPPPAVCNRVTGLLSPDPDTHTLKGALVQGSGLSDNYLDIRNNDAARVGVENNAGFTGALAGATMLPDGMWEVCLQQFGIYRSNPVCGSFVAV